MTWDNFEEFNIGVIHEWPKELQELVDMGLVKIHYDENDVPHFSLTDKGKAIVNATDPELN